MEINCNLTLLYTLQSLCNLPSTVQQQAQNYMQKYVQTETQTFDIFRFANKEVLNAMVTPHTDELANVSKLSIDTPGDVNDSNCGMRVTNTNCPTHVQSPNLLLKNRQNHGNVQF